MTGLLQARQRPGIVRPRREDAVETRFRAVELAALQGGEGDGQRLPVGFVRAGGADLAKSLIDTGGERIERTRLLQ